MTSIDLGLPSKISLRIGLFLLSASVLSLELLGMRILSFMLWHHLAYVVLSVAMLGFGASGAWLSSTIRSINPRKMIVWSALLFSITNVLGFALLVHIGLDTFEMGWVKLFKLGLYYFVLFIPYFFAGLAIAAIFRAIPQETTSLYFFNLAGSGVGCQLFMFIITPLGGEMSLVFCSLLGAVAALFWARESTRPLQISAMGIAIALAIAMPFSTHLFPIKPAQTKGLAIFMTHPGAKIEFTEWTPLSRIDVGHAEKAMHPFLRRWIPGDMMRTITIDGDANTWVFDHKEVAEDLKTHPNTVNMELLKANPYALAFLTKKNPETLIVGVGGGNEVAVALSARAKHVTGVEINPAILAQSTRLLAEFFGGLYESGRATPVLSEGRSFVRRTDKKFDIIQMSGVDTWTGLSSGAYVLSENYLYTVEAVKDFLGHLTADGVLSMGRYLMAPPRETLRLVSNAMRALKEMGVEDPAKHMLVLTRGPAIGARLLVKRSPWTKEEIEFYHDLVTKERIDKDIIWYGPHLEGRLIKTPFTCLIDAIGKGPEAEQAFYEGYQYDVTPVYDEKPFFFEYYKWKNIFADMTDGGFGGQVGAKRPIALLILFFLIAQVIVLSALFIFLPLRRLRRRGSPLPERLSVIVGFGGLGLAFMFLEVGFMQKFVLFLGHPIYSISVSLFSILVFSGLGSLTAGRLPWNPTTRLKLSIAAISVIVLIYLFAINPLFDALLGFPLIARQFIAGALIALLAFPMGMPFPLSLAAAGKLSGNAVPWALGINGAMGVLGSVLCIIFAMSFGFAAVMAIAGGIYVLTLPFLVHLARRAEG